jgi:hypothetical protein
MGRATSSWLRIDGTCSAQFFCSFGTQLDTGVLGKTFVELKPIFFDSGF